MAYKSPLDLANSIEKEPLHIRSLKEQVSHNPNYKKIADSISNGQDDINDAYFYALKDAYEKSGYNPSEDDIRREAWDSYYRLSDSFKDNWGYNDRDWDYYGVPRFEEKYGTEQDFIQKLIDAHTNYFNNLDKANQRR